MFFTDRRDPGGKPHGNRCQQHHKAGQQPVFQKHGHRDHGDLKHTLHHHIKDLVDIPADLGNIAGHPAQDIANRGLIHILHRQPADLIGKLDADAAAVVTADHIVHQQHIEIAEDLGHPVYRQQQQQPLHQRRLNGAHRAAAPEIIQLLHQLTQDLRGSHRAQHRQNIQQRAQQQPVSDGLRLPDQTNSRLVDSFSHYAIPPVWEA